MKNIHKLLLSFSFVFAVCLSAGLFFIFSGQEKLGPPKTDEDVAVAASTTTATIALNPLLCFYNAVNSDGSVSSTTSVAVGVTDSTIYYHNHYGSSQHLMARLQVSRGTNVVSVNTLITASGSYSISIGILSQKERRFSVSLNSLSSCKITGLTVTYLQGETLKSTIINEELEADTYSKNNTSFYVGSNTEKSTKIVISPLAEYTYTLSSSLSFSTEKTIKQNPWATYSSDSAFSSFERTGYTLNGFYTKSSGGTRVIERYEDQWKFNSIVTPGTTLYAQYTPYNYKVNFNANGGSGSMSAQDFKYGISQNLKNNTFTRTGYSFKGWATSVNGGVTYSNGQSVNNLTTTNNGTVNLYAVWEINKYYVDVNHYLDSVNQLNNSQTGFTFSVKVDGVVKNVNVSDFFEEITYNSTVEIYDIKYNDDVRYSGYILTDNSAEISGSTSLNIKIKVLAKRVDINLQFLAIDKFSLTINNGVSTQIAGVGEKTLVSLEVPNRPGYIFTGWSITSGGGKILDPQYLTEEKSFNGTSDYINIGRTHMYTDKFLFSAWAYMDNWADYGVTDTSMRIISSTEWGGWNIESISGNIKCAIFESGVGYTSIESSKKWSSLASGWHNFVLTFDGKKGTLFIDNEKIQESAMFTHSLGYNSSNSMFIGAEASSGSTPAGSYFNGKIRDVIIINDCAYDASTESYFLDSGNANFAYYYLSGDTDAVLTANWVETWAVHQTQTTLLQDSEGYYLISSAEDLARIAHQVSLEDRAQIDCKFRLTNNIDLSGKAWLPIGIENSVAFQGAEFDGQGYTIYGLKTYGYDLAGAIRQDVFNNLKDKSYVQRAGLFGKVENTLIKNLKLENVGIKSIDNAGGIVSDMQHSVIENCQVSGVIISSRNAGGIANTLTRSNIINCVNYADVYGRYHGGIIGSLTHGHIKNCVNYGMIVNYEIGSDFYYGGIAGRVYGNTSIIESCINNGEIVNQKSVDGTAGIAGSIEASDVKVISCANYGDIISTSAPARFSAGIVARNYYSGVVLQYCSSVGEITSRGSVAEGVSLIYNCGVAPEMIGCYASMKVGDSTILTNQKSGLDNDFVEGYRFVAGMNNDLPMQLSLFTFANQIPKQADIVMLALNEFVSVG